MGTLPDGFSASRLDSQPNRTLQATVRKRRPHDNFRVRVRPARGSCAARRQGHDCGNPYIAGMECRSGAKRPLIAAHRARSSRRARTIRRDRSEGSALDANRDSQRRKSKNLEQDWRRRARICTARQIRSATPQLLFKTWVWDPRAGVEELPRVIIKARKGPRIPQAQICRLRLASASGISALMELWPSG